MRKIFLDCGAHCGCSRRKFLQEMYMSHTYEIFSFEPDPSFNKYCPDLINQAIWVQDCKQTFYKIGTTGGSCLSRTKADYMRSRKHRVEEIEVECIDLHKFITSNFSLEDFILLKLDIEGAEYEVLEHLLRRGTLDHIDGIYAEFHGTKVGKTVEDGQKLSDRIKSTYNLPVNDWSAMKIGFCIKHSSGKNIWS